MATTQKTASPKKSQGFTGVRGATLFFTWFANGMHFQDGDSANSPLDVWGTIYKGGVIVPVIHTLLLTVIAMSIERWLALKTAFGKGALPKFVANIKAALNANDFTKAQQLCDAQRGSVANVVGASLRAYKEMEATPGLKKSQKIAKIQRDAYSDNESPNHRYPRNPRYTYRTSRYCGRYDQVILCSVCRWWC